MADNAQAPVFYDIVKNCRGGLTLTIPAFDSTSIDRVVDFAWNTSKIRVPRTYALGIFVNPTLERLYKEGKIRVEPAKQFEREVSEIFFPVEDKKEVVPNNEIKEMLIKGNRAKIKNLINTNPLARDTIIITARENIGDLSVSMIKDLEEILQIELVVENE